MLQVLILCCCLLAACALGEDVSPPLPKRPDDDWRASLEVIDARLTRLESLAVARPDIVQDYRELAEGNLSFMATLNRHVSRWVQSLLLRREKRGGRNEHQIHLNKDDTST